MVAEQADSWSFHAVPSGDEVLTREHARPASRSTLTAWRRTGSHARTGSEVRGCSSTTDQEAPSRERRTWRPPVSSRASPVERTVGSTGDARSEEHTSELQS